MKLVLDTTKSLEENAALYFEKSKKAKRKVEGIEKTIELTKKKMFFEEEKKQEQKKYVEAPQKKWYMKFRWFISSDGFLCIGGRDATTNEILVKKHTEKTDLVFHTDLAGSPFFVIKAEGKEIPKMAKEETAQATASFSRAWTQGLTTAEVYAIAPDQVKKELGLPKGAFMIHGKREYFKPIIKLYIGINKENYIECSPLKKEYPLKQEGKKTDTAKFLQQRFIEKTNIKYSVDEIMQALPGDCSVDMQ
ncbi:MAG: hypothetical protein QT08_C0008G0011 [archaeon GW2011_AR17]|nr:MAG: hypothetical protein QT08_C0008G0011 [archaeon GW2011_AR17]MBS3153775.1 DUF814 domain-containing protein [Candidatus Woesearchaeota archaeon]HIH15199.1 DUF814 domain-containing protein [Nanoarchaeota archaeon]HIH59465.1 DUF814 domain-containing protein [Nanoarchaeota archaeon]HII13863.1 DUF814 domain-containing protein [Nanoarchaeota archaeon]